MIGGRKARIEAFLGAGTDLEGRISFSGHLRIDGRFKGEIEGPEGSLTVGPTAEVEARMRVGYLTVVGKVKGEVTAAQGILIHRGASLWGNIRTPNVRIDEGAVFHGLCHMMEEEDSEQEEKVTFFPHERQSSST